MLAYVDILGCSEEVCIFLARRLFSRFFLTSRYARLGRSTEALQAYSDAVRIRQGHDPCDRELAGMYLAMAKVCSGRCMSRSVISCRGRRHEERTTVALS